MTGSLPQLVEQWRRECAEHQRMLNEYKLADCDRVYHRAAIEYKTRCADDLSAALQALPPPPEKDMVLSLHRCKVCGTAWLLWPAGVGGTVGESWNLLDKYQRPGACCDNVAMGKQI